MRDFVFIISLLLLPVMSVYGQFRDVSTYEDLYDSETVAALKSHVGELSAAVLEGRKAGSEGEKSAAEYVEEQFKEYGVELLSPAGGDLFGLKSEAGDTLTSRNVIGCVQGYDKSLKNRYIVVGARLDNIGTMTMTVDGTPVERIFYGANGNASGLAMLLELAKKVKTK